MKDKCYAAFKDIMETDTSRHIQIEMMCEFVRREYNAKLKNIALDLKNHIKVDINVEQVFKKQGNLF